MNGDKPENYRKIIHIDMDAFYASVEQRDNVAYRNKPVIVGGSPQGRGGVVASASYEARKFGIHSAMSSKMALQRCKDVVFIRPRFDVYKEVSGSIRAIFHRYTDIVEPLSLDEAYLDVTSDKQQIGSAIEIATLIRRAIRDELQLTASAGVSVNKFLAKVASDLDKPDGLTFIGPSRIQNFMENLAVEKFYGVGKVTAAKMKSMGLHTGSDLKKISEGDLIKHFGKSGKFFYNIVRGIDNRIVQPHREAKSIGAEDTFPFDLTTLEEMFEALDKIAEVVYERLKRSYRQARTITLKIKYHDFKLATRSQSLATPVDDIETITKTAKELLKATELEDRKIRLLGISLSNFGDVVSKPANDNPEQLALRF